MQPLGMIHVGEFCEGLYPGAEEEPEEGWADMNDCEVLQISFSITLDCSEGGRRKFGSCVSLRRKKE